VLLVIAELEEIVSSEQAVRSMRRKILGIKGPKKGEGEPLLARRCIGHLTADCDCVWD
jgi:hypothetical protein